MAVSARAMVTVLRLSRLQGPLGSNERLPMNMSKLLDLYEHLRAYSNRDYVYFAKRALRYLETPAYRHSARSDRNALGVNACSAGLALIHTIDAFVAGLNADPQVRMPSPNGMFAATLRLARGAVAEFLRSNFDQATVDASAKSLGLTDCGIVSRIPTPEYDGRPPV